MHKIKCILETICDFMEEQKLCFLGLKFKILLLKDLAF